MILDNEDYQILIQRACTWTASGCPMVQRNLFRQKEPQWCYWHINVHGRNFQTFPRHATGWPCFTQQKFPSVLYIITWNLPINDSVVFWMLVKLIIIRKKNIEDTDHSWKNRKWHKSKYRFLIFFRMKVLQNCDDTLLQLNNLSKNGFSIKFSNTWQKSIRLSIDFSSCYTHILQMLYISL